MLCKKCNSVCAITTVYVLTQSVILVYIFQVALQLVKYTPCEIYTKITFS